MTEQEIVKQSIQALERDYGVEIVYYPGNRRISHLRYIKTGKKVTKKQFIAIAQDLRKRGLSLV